MSNQEDLNKHKIELKDLVQMCAEAPDNVTLSNRAEKDAYTDFGLPNKAEVKKFIGDGNLENPVFLKCSNSEQIADVVITEYNFQSGRKQGYLAYHKNKRDQTKVNIKSFHKNQMHPQAPLGTLGDLLGKDLLKDIGERNE